MIIGVSFVKNGKCYAIFTGSDLQREQKIKKIKIGPFVYDVLRLEIRESFSGQLIGEMEVDSSIPLPIGEFSIIEKTAA